MLDPELGFTSSVIRDPRRFVGRRELIRDCIKALATPVGLIAVYGKRGVGKSSLLRQLQQMALGDYEIAKLSGNQQLIPSRPRKYLTVYYSCDSMIKSAKALLLRLCNDQDDEDGLLRLVPNDGKDLVEFSRSKEVSGGVDLKVVNWGAKGIESSKYARVVPNDVVQTFRNFISAIITHQVHKRMGRDALLVILDEFDVIEDKAGMGSIIKSLSSETLKFAVCGVARDLSELVEDHASTERLLEEGALQLRPMPPAESKEIILRAMDLFSGKISFDPEVVDGIASLSEGYPYLTQLIGKECVETANQHQVNTVTTKLFEEVLEDIRSGEAFPTLEDTYQRAIGESKDRAVILHLLAEQSEDTTSFDEVQGRIALKSIRGTAADLEVQYIDQLVPRLVDKKFGPVLLKVGDRRGVYEFDNPVFRVYVKLRNL